jgi:hypothetical protein
MKDSVTQTTILAAVSTLLMGLWVPGPALAQESDWQRASERLAGDQEITVVTTDGTTGKGVLTAIDASGVTLTLSTGTVRYDVSQIVEVRRRGDSVWNGALIGSAAGGAFGLLGYAHPCSGRSCYREEFLGAFATLGLGVGLAIDALRVGSTSVYRQPSPRRVAILPLVGRQRFGAAALLTFGD